MKTRDAVLDYQKTIKDTETYTKDLTLTEPISAIELEVQCTNGATSNKGNYISDIVTKVELMDGSTTLWSLNMSQLEALQFFKTGVMPCIFPSEWAAGQQRHNAMIMFGRHLWDRDYAFNPKAFTNPQLKVTMNKAAIRAASATGFASGDNILLTAIAKVFVDVGAPGSYLMARQIENFTSAASGEKRVDLPLDYLYRMLLCRFWKQGSDIDEIVTDLKLTCDVDKFTPINRTVKQLDAHALGEFGHGKLKHDIFVSHQAEFRLVFNKEITITPFLAELLLYDIVGVNWAWSSGAKIDLASHAGVADTTDRKLTMMEIGHAPHACLPVPFGRINNPEDWFNPKEYEKLELVLTQAVASAVCEIAAEQVRPNAP